MKDKIALQLYTVREALAADYEGVIAQVAQWGYPAVELGLSPDRTAADTARILAREGLEVAAIHAPLPVGDNEALVLEAAEAFECPRLVTGKGPDDFATRDAIKASCEAFNAGAAAAKAHGLSLSLHNHWWEFGLFEDRRVYQVMLEDLSEDVYFEVDVYWVQTGGCDPVAVLRELGSRAKLLHMKDGPCERDQPMTALGEGKVDLEGVIAAAQGHAEYYIAELDACATDMLEAAEKSYRFLEKALG